MATAKAGEVLFSIRAELNQLRADMREMNKTFDSGFKGVTNQAAAFGRSLASSLGLGLSVSAVVGFGKSLLDLGDKLSDLSDTTGISIRTLAGLRTLADQSGTSLDTFARGVLIAQKNLGTMDEDGKGAAEALRQMGLSVKEMMQASPDEFLQKFAAGLATVEDRNKRAAIAAQVFGKAGTELIPMLQTIAENGLPRVSEETAKAYKVLGDLKDRFAQVTAEAADFWANLIGRGVSAAGFGKTLREEIDEEIQQLQTFLRTRLGGPAQDLERLQLRLTALQRLREKVAAGEAAAAAKPRVAATSGSAPKGVVGGIPADDSQKKVNAFAESLRRQNLELEQNIIQLTQGEEAALRFAKAQELAALTADVKTISPEQAKRIRELTDEFFNLRNQVEDTKLALEQTFSAQFEKDMEGQFADIQKFSKETRAELATTVEDIKEQTDDLTVFMERSFERMQDALGDGLKDLLSGQIKSWEDFGRRILGIISDITAEWLAMQAKVGLFGPEFGKPGGQIGGLIGSIAGLFGGASVPNLNAPGTTFSVGGSFPSAPFARQHGGPVWPGRDFLVGERGPEIFRSAIAGRIEPMRRGAGGPNVNVSMVVNTPDANSFRQSGNQIHADLYRAMSTAAKRLGMQRD